MPLSTLAMSEQEYSDYMSKIGKERNPNIRLSHIQEFFKLAEDDERFSLLPRAAKTAFKANDYISAKQYASELLNLAQNNQRNWNYGNAIHDGNMILGRLAVRDGNIKLAIYYLLKSGETPGSPQLKTYGPSMSLAKDLTDIGETKTVIQYFELCKKFWKKNDGRLDSWSASIRGGGKPYYGRNLRY